MDEATRSKTDSGFAKCGVAYCVNASGRQHFAPGAFIRRNYWTLGNMHPANMQPQDFELWLYLSLKREIVQSIQQSVRNS